MLPQQHTGCRLLGVCDKIKLYARGLNDVKIVFSLDLLYWA